MHASSHSPIRILTGLMALTLGLAFAAQAQKPEQVQVSVKIIEFQTTKGVETGLSAYFAKLSKAQPFGQATSTGSTFSQADLTFPTSTAAGLTVFLDRISIDQGEIEVVLQALVDENRAFILSRPHAMVVVGEKTATVVGTTNKIPYENTVAVGSTVVQVTAFEETGVSLTVKAEEIIDDDGDWNTRHDTYVRLDVQASVKEEGQRIVISLDDSLAAGGDFSLAKNAIQVPEFISREIHTKVWVRDGQVLMLGGLYRNTESVNISTLPWLTQAEDAAIGFAESLISRSLPSNPLSATIGNRKKEEGRRELVFLIRTEAWKPAFTVSNSFGFDEQKEPKAATPPKDAIDAIPESTPAPDTPGGDPR